MTYTYTYSICKHCGQPAIFGETVDYRCSPCRRKGHNQHGSCDICKGLRSENRDPLENLDQIIMQSIRRKG